jgi:hypothetical protein
MGDEMTTQVNRTHLYEMEIRKHKMSIEGIETQQSLMSQQLINQRAENENALLLQHANLQIQQFQIE